MRRLGGLALALMLSLLGLADGAAAGTGYRGMPEVAGRPIEAEDFDNGGAGNSYSVGVPDHSGTYRQSDVCILAGGSNGYCVGHLAVGDWLAYTIHAPLSGNYVFSATVVSPGAGAQFHVSFDGVDRTGAIQIPKTRDKLDWNTVESHPFWLVAGDHVMRLQIDRNATGCAIAGNFDTLFVTPLRPGVTLWWKAAADAPAARFEGVGRVVGGKLYTFGGFTSVVPYGVTNRASVYDPAAGNWTDLGEAPIPETHCGVAVDEANHRIVFLGGRRGTYPGVATDEVWQYDIAANAWTRLGPLPEPLSAGVADYVNGQIHYMGGNRGENRTADYDLHYVLDRGSTTWRKAALLPFRGDHFSSIVLGGKLYLFGGEVRHDTLHRQQTNSFAYDPVADTWRL